jgi:cytochrome c biogenesis protein ResB
MIKIIIKKLSSLRLAVFLIFFLTFLGLWGSSSAGAVSICRFKAGLCLVAKYIAYSRLVTMVFILEPLGLLNVFHSFCFLGISALLALNILVCTISRAGALRQNAGKAKTQTETEFYRSGNFVYELKRLRHQAGGRGGFFVFLITTTTQSAVRRPEEYLHSER